MPRITNIFVWAQFSDDTGKFVYNGAVPTADEVVVRQINYSGTDGAAVIGIYAVHSNLNDGVIGLCSNLEGYVSNPQTRIQLRNCPTNLEFQLFQTTMDNPRKPAGVAGEFIGLSLDFIQN